MIRKGMLVRTPDGEKLGRVASVGTDDFIIERGLVFKRMLVAPLEHVIAIDDERDEILCRPIELPFREREKEEVMFGTPETAEELAKREDESRFAQELAEDPHLH